MRSILFFALVALSYGFVHPPARGVVARAGRKAGRGLQLSLRHEEEKQREVAEDLSKRFGKDSPQAALASSFVDELEAAHSHITTLTRTWSEMCKTNPDARGCEVYQERLSRLSMKGRTGLNADAHLIAENHKLKEQLTQLRAKAKFS